MKRGLYNADWYRSTLCMFQVRKSILLGRFSYYNLLLPLMRPCFLLVPAFAVPLLTVVRLCEYNKYWLIFRRTENRLCLLQNKSIFIAAGGGRDFLFQQLFNKCTYNAVGFGFKILHGTCKCKVECSEWWWEEKRDRSLAMQHSLKFKCQ